ncbi:hypothetical protein OIU34_13495 [Pararhizobium sp. BT-229]|uniref:hypothetical protein n=1 Tax=Pararhizobium sp. BT-229 TaxID=2986923 RepID=UPI0021F7C8BF|nr:hypothetical protein [Pararhizobium sp. BT-229]MCV9962918.1 hypothetical protein [Pararhizobium sp. BT-229]
MTVSTSNIWKSAASAVRQPVRAREKNLHIGSTLQDLYRQEQMPNGEQTFDDLLDQLDAAEKAADARS